MEQNSKVTGPDSRIILSVWILSNLHKMVFSQCWGLFWLVVLPTRWYWPLPEVLLICSEYISKLKEGNILPPLVKSLVVSGVISLHPDTTNLMLSYPVPLRTNGRVSKERESYYWYGKMSFRRKKGSLQNRWSDRRNCLREVHWKYLFWQEELEKGKMNSQNHY